MADQLQVDIVTPDGRAFRGRASGIRAPGIEGSFEVLANHAPMIAAFGIGPLVLRTDDAHEFADVHDDRIVFATSGGFVEVVNNQVTVLAETVEPSSEIDVERAEQAEEQARKRIEGLRGEERQEAEKALERARNRVRVAMGQIGG